MQLFLSLVLRSFFLITFFFVAIHSIPKGREKGFRKEIVCEYNH